MDLNKCTHELCNKQSTPGWVPTITEMDQILACLLERGLVQKVGEGKGKYQLTNEYREHLLSEAKKGRKPC